MANELSTDRANKLALEMCSFSIVSLTYIVALVISLFIIFR